MCAGIGPGSSWVVATPSNDVGSASSTAVREVSGAVANNVDSTCIHVVLTWASSVPLQTMRVQRDIYVVLSLRRQIAIWSLGVVSTYT